MLDLKEGPAAKCAGIAMEPKAKGAGRLAGALGAIERRTLEVDAMLTVPAVSPSFSGFSDMPPVFATAFLVGFVEWACIEALKPHLGPGEKSVGTRIEVSHCAATPIGMNVTTHVELVEVEGRKLRFVVLCWDDFDLVAEGVHERVVVDEARFLSKAEAKAARAANGAPTLPTAA